MLVDIYFFGITFFLSAHFHGSKILCQDAVESGSGAHDSWQDPCFLWQLVKRKSIARLYVDIYVCTHTIHVWYIYLHLVDFYGKCRGWYGVYTDGK